MFAAEGVVQSVDDDWVVRVVADFSVSVAAPAATHLEEVDPVFFGEPRTLGQIPRRRERREQPEAVVQAEARRTVVTKRAHQGPLVAQVVRRTHELTDPGRFADAVAGPWDLRRHVEAVAQERVSWVVGRQAVARCGDARRVGLQRRVTCNHLELVLVFEFLGVSQGVLPLPGRPLVFRANEGVHFAEFRGWTVGIAWEQSQIERREENLLRTQRQVYVHRGTELQVGGQIHFSKHVAHKAVGRPGVVGLLDLVDGVDDVAVDVIRVCECFIDVAHRRHRVDVQCAQHGGGELVVLRQRVALDVREGDVLTHLETVSRLLL